MDGGASVIRALVRNGGTCRPAGVAGQWRGRARGGLDASKNPKQLICEGESSVRGKGADRLVVAVKALVMRAGAKGTGRPGWLADQSR